MKASPNNIRLEVKTFISFLSFHPTILVYKLRYWIHFRCWHPAILTCKNLPLHWIVQNLMMHPIFNPGNIFTTQKFLYNIDVIVRKSFYIVKNGPSLSNILHKKLRKKCNQNLCKNKVFFLLSLYSLIYWRKAWSLEESKHFVTRQDYEWKFQFQYEGMSNLDRIAY